MLFSDPIKIAQSRVGVSSESSSSGSSKHVPVSLSQFIEGIPSVFSYWLMFKW